MMREYISMVEIEIYFDDLSAEKQQEILDAYEIDSPDEMNWDCLPLTSIAIGE